MMRAEKKGPIDQRIKRILSCRWDRDQRDEWPEHTCTGCDNFIVNERDVAYTWTSATAANSAWSTLLQYIIAGHVFVVVPEAGGGRGRRRERWDVVRNWMMVMCENVM